MPSESYPSLVDCITSIREATFRKADDEVFRQYGMDQTPNFITQFWGAVADLTSRTVQRPEHVETTGDGLYMVFRAVGEAGRYAL